MGYIDPAPRVPDIDYVIVLSYVIGKKTFQIRTRGIYEWILELYKSLPSVDNSKQHEDNIK